MSDWKQLEKDITKWISKLNSGQLYFRNAFQAIVGFPRDGFRSDGMLADDNVLFAVEVEAGQTHPDTNTGKYWLLNDKYKSYDKIVLFHIYTPDFNSYGYRKELAEFYIEKMTTNVPIEYILLDYRRADDYSSTLIDIKTKIKKKAKEIFG